MDKASARPFGFWTATALVVGGMIGSGIFLVPSALAPFGWTGTLAWVVAIGGAITIAWTLSRLAQTMPEATGAITVAAAVVGPLAGLLIGWSYWVAVWSANAAIAIAATSYLAAVLPWLDATPLTGALVAVGLIWALTLLNVAGAKRAGEFQVVTTVLKLMPLIAVVVIAASLMTGGTVAVPPLPAPHMLLTGLAPAVTLTLFALVGFEAAGIAAERVRDPARTIIRATMAGTVVTGLLYVVVCSAIVLLLPPRAVAASPAPFALFVETFWGHGPALWVALFAAVAAVGALNGWVLIQGEVPLGMARAGLLPRWFARVSARDVPVGVLLLSSALASALVLSHAERLARRHLHLRHAAVDLLDFMALPRDLRRGAGPPGRARRGGDRGAVRAVRLLGRGVGSERPQPRADADRNSGVSAAVTRRVCRTSGLAHFDP